MKKTIAILALAASSFASADAMNPTYPNPLTLPSESNITALTASVLLNVSTLQSWTMVGAPAVKHHLINFVDEGGNRIGIQTNYTSENDKIKVSGLWGMANEGGAYGFGIDDMQSKLTGVAAAVLTLSYSYDTGTTALLTVVYSNGLIADYGGTWNTGLRYQGIEFDRIDFGTGSYMGKYVAEDTAWTVDQMKEYARSADGWAIGLRAPEPTTATLSLLALAGLAARRRRK
ncbi:MAG: PEP-CTERM sorting domain-containing protein [Akkermansia sp.]|nr:PEP-CTERM sorting domain-containing protein [Akkermansia sp.]